MMTSATGPTEFALIIGAMKSGTTSLFELLSQHPEIAAARVKEPRYFAEESAWRRGWEWYVSLWDWNPARHRVALEASTAYTTFPARKGVPGRIASVKGARFRFIYVMRHPLEQIASNIRHGLYVGYLRSLDHGIPEWIIETVQYATQIEQYLSVFPRDSLMLLTLEEFGAHPEAVLRRICRFLGVAQDFPFRGAERRYNVGVAYEVPTAVAGVVKVGWARSVARRLLPRGAWHLARSALARLGGRGEPLGRYRLNEREKAIVLERLHGDLQRLESVHGVSVRRWWSLTDTATRAEAVRLS